MIDQTLAIGDSQDPQLVIAPKRPAPTFGPSFGQLNRRWQIVAEIEQRFAQEAAKGKRLLAFTVVYTHPKKPHTLDTCDRLLQQAYLQLCSSIVHRHNYLRAKYAPLMPLFVAFPEADALNEIHHHGVLAIHPSLEPELQPFMVDRGWRPLNRQIASSSMAPIYDLHGWLDYCTPSSLALDAIAWHGPKEKDLTTGDIQ